MGILIFEVRLHNTLYCIRILYRHCILDKGFLWIGDDTILEDDENHGIGSLSFKQKGHKNE